MNIQMHFHICECIHAYIDIYICVFIIFIIVYLFFAKLRYTEGPVTL